MATSSSNSHATPADYPNPVPAKGEKGANIELMVNPAYVKISTTKEQPVQKTIEEFYDYINPEDQEAKTMNAQEAVSPQETGPPPHLASVKREGSGCVTCVVVSVLIVFVVSVLALVVAVATLAITTQQNNELQRQIAGLMRRNTELTKQNAELQEERESSQMLVDSLSNRIQVLEQQLLTEDTTTPPSTQPPPTTPVTTPTPEPLQEVTLSGLNLFQNCNTSIEGRCTIDPGAPATGNDFLSCTTNIEGVTINRPGEYVLNVQCLIVEETVESNPLIATLDVDANLGFCRCYVPTLNSANQVGNPVTCGLQITRCTIPTNITARLLPIRLG